MRNLNIRRLMALAVITSSIAVLFLALAYTKAQDQPINKTELFASSCYGDWESPGNAAGEPDIQAAKTANAFYFNNSAFTSEATSSLVCQNFTKAISLDQDTSVVLPDQENSTKISSTSAAIGSKNIGNEKRIKVKAFLSLAIKNRIATETVPTPAEQAAGSATTTAENNQQADQLKQDAIDAGEISTENGRIPEQSDSNASEQNASGSGAKLPGQDPANIEPEKTAASSTSPIFDDQKSLLEKAVDGIIDTFNNMLDLVTFTEADAQDENQEPASDSLAIRLSYSTDGQNWIEFAQINYGADQTQNQYSFELPGLFSETELKALRVKAENADQSRSVEIYLDSVWLQAIEKAAENQAMDNAIQSLVENGNFSLFDNINLKFKYNKGSRSFLDQLKGALGLEDFWSNIEVRAEIYRANGEDPGLPATVEFGNSGEFAIKAFRTKRKIKPGSYSVKITIKDSSTQSIKSFNQNFTWGVLAFNSNKDAYRRGENAFLQLATLDEQGETVCDSKIRIEVVAPSGEIEILSTENGLIEKSAECGPSSVTSQPDYFSNYILSQSGKYQFKISATIAGQARSAEYWLESREDSAYEIERVSATRIYPKAAYQMFVQIKFHQDYAGDIYEYLPAEFSLVSSRLRIIKKNGDESSGENEVVVQKLSEEDQALKWSGLKLENGDQIIIAYIYDAPDISPELYLAGPLQLRDYTEKRQWQIASDAVKTRAKTIMLLAGRYTGNGTTGQNSDANQTLSVFNIELPEKDVDIKNAYVLFDARYDSYVNNTSYTGYTLAFDAAPSTETPLPFTGTSSISVTNTSTLSYDESDSNQVRLLSDVTTEGQLDSYTGNGTILKAQVGYSINRTAAPANSISYSRAILYLTYTYDASNSTTTANTVIYPLEVNGGSYRGTKGAMQADDCQTDVSCPTFGYNMDVAEFSSDSGSKNLSQWFDITQNNDTGLVNDITTAVNIQGDDRPSYTYYHEVGALGDQGSYPIVSFDDVLGYSENSTQNLEVSNACVGAALYYMLGGEVFETYTASSSAAVKTRTASFPLGVINTGATFATSSVSVNVYFPENGTASGTVTVKKAWLRIISNAYTSGLASTSIATKVGNNATSSWLSYAYNESGRVVNPSLYIINVLPSADTSTLAMANSASPTPVTIFTANTSNTLQGGLSAELMITYTYTDETNGYLTSLNLFGGQSLVNPATATTTPTSNFVAPEPAHKTIRAGGLKASYLFSNSGAAMPTGFITADTNISTATPVCTSTNAYRLSGSGRNVYGDFYRNVASSLLTTNSQAYKVCISNGGVTGTGAKMNSQLIYTYQWDNSAPTSTFIAAATSTRHDGSGIADLSLLVSDLDGNNARARLEFATGTTCDFSNPQKMTIDATDANATSTYDDAKIDNSSYYQVGTTTGWITTSNGPNQVSFDWQSNTDLPNADAAYCVRAIANDLAINQVAPATTTLTIDNRAPTMPGVLSATSTRATSSIIIFGATSTETHFREYVIYYKIAGGSDPGEADNKIGSTTSSNFLSATFGGATSTPALNLAKNTTYAFNIWAYDTYGHKSSSSVYQFTTNEPPTGSINSIMQKTDGSGTADISIEVNDYNDSDTCRARIIMATGTICNFSTFTKPTLNTAGASIQADFGNPQINNADTYQVGNDSGWIKTSPGSNTVNIDWLSLNDVGTATGTYCFKLVVNDGLDDQVDLATATTSIDNVPPTLPGALSIEAVTQTTAKLLFGAQSKDENFSRYKIFYKIGTSGVTEMNTEWTDTNLNTIDYGGKSSTTVSGLNPNTYYVFNIWAYDLLGNKLIPAEVYGRTDATIMNSSLTFIDPVSSNFAVAEAENYATFRAVVSETNGYMNLASTTLRLADSSDSAPPLNDLEFTWYETGRTFAERGSDVLGAASLSPISSSTCANNTCTIDFKIIFNYKFTSSSVNYNAELYSLNDGNIGDEDSYSNFYQVKTVRSRQMHYRWRNDDGTE
jgi:hypothetical protein